MKPMSPQSSTTSTSKLLTIARSCALGLCITGFVMACLPWVIRDLPYSSASNLQLLGGFSAVIFGTLVAMLNNLIGKHGKTVSYLWYLPAIGSVLFAIIFVLPSLISTAQKEAARQSTDLNLRSLGLALRDYEVVKKELDVNKDVDAVRQRLLGMAKGEYQQAEIASLYRENKEIIKQNWKTIRIVPDVHEQSTEAKLAYGLYIMTLAKLFEEDGDPSLAKDLATSDEAPRP